MECRLKGCFYYDETLSMWWDHSSNINQRGRSISQAIWKCKLSTWNKQLEEAERNPYQGMAYSLRDKLSSRRKQRLQFSLSLEICCHIPYMGFLGLGFVNISIIFISSYFHIWLCISRFTRVHLCPLSASNHKGLLAL